MKKSRSDLRRHFIAGRHAARKLVTDVVIAQSLRKASDALLDYLKRNNVGDRLRLHEDSFAPKLLIAMCDEGVLQAYLSEASDSAVSNMVGHEVGQRELIRQLKQVLEKYTIGKHTIGECSAKQGKALEESPVSRGLPALQSAVRRAMRSTLIKEEAAQWI